LLAEHRDLNDGLLGFGGARGQQQGGNQPQGREMLQHAAKMEADSPGVKSPSARAAAPALRIED
jgi:hypothetical protein